MNADLRPVWNWNVKQLFVFITAEYTTEEHVGVYMRLMSHAILTTILLQPLNQVILWDLIITEKENAIIDKQGVRQHCCYDSYVPQCFLTCWRL